MAGWKASALGLVGVLILAAHPGCIASTESLAVAPRRSGDAVELTTKVDRYHAGRESHDGISGPIEVEHVQESSTVRTAYTRGVEQDRFLRDADAVALLVDLHTEFQRDQDRGWYEYQQRSVFELASAEPLFVDYIRSAANYGADDCGACGATHSNEQRWRTYAPEFIDDPSFGDLAGRTLIPGETIVQTRNVSEPWGDWTFTLRFVFVREEALRGERAFVYRVESEAELVGTTPAALAPPLAMGDVHRLPTTTHAWFVASVPEPIKVLTEDGLEFEGTTYRGSRLVEVSKFSPGKEPFAWGQGKALEASDRSPYMYFGKLSKFLDGSEAFTSYPLSDAWRRVSKDDSLAGFQSYRKANPGEVPTIIKYLPEAEEDSYTWAFTFGGDRNEQGAETRRSSPVSPQLPSLYQNRESEHKAWLLASPLTAAQVQTLEIGSLADAQMLSRRLLGSNKEPMMELMLGMRESIWMGEEPYPVARLVVAPPRLAQQVNTPLSWMRVVESEGTLVVDLLDGGLKAINSTDLSELSMGPWQSIPSPFAIVVGESSSAHSLERLGVAAPEGLLRAAHDDERGAERRPYFAR